MFTLEQLASHLDGRVAGDPGLQISGVRPFEETRPGDITLAARRSYLTELGHNPASAFILATEVEAPGKSLLLVENPKLAFARILQLFYSKPFSATGISPLAFIGKGSRVSSRVSIYPHVYVGDEVVIEDEVTICAGVSIGDRCRVGRGSTLFANVTLYPDVVVGQRVRIHSGTVIGSDGFGYVFDGERQQKIPQTGSVEIQDDVEIGANSCIDRATFGRTVIEQGVKLDNLVHVGHNCRIGQHTVIVGCVGISGSVTIGKNCIFAGQSGVSDHITVGDHVTVMSKTAVTRDLPAGSVVSGHHGRDHREVLKTEAILRKLPQLYQEWQDFKRSRTVRESEDQTGR